MLHSSKLVVDLHRKMEFIYQSCEITNYDVNSEYNRTNQAYNAKSLDQSLV